MAVDVEERQLMEGYAFVGQFFHAFAQLEQRLDAALANVLKLDDAARLIVADNMPIQGKVNALRSIIVANFSDANGKQLAKKDAKLDVLKRVMAVNQSTRVKLAHKPFEVSGGKIVFFDASTKSGELKHTNLEIAKADFASKLSELRRIADDLGDLVEGLTLFEPSLDFSDSRNSGLIALL